MSTFTAVENLSRRDVLKLFGAVGGRTCIRGEWTNLEPHGAGTE